MWAVKLFRGLGDPTRLAILLALTGGERRVVDLVGEIGSSQANVSAHLACLKDCGLLTDRPDGRTVFYRAAVATLRDLFGGAEGCLGRWGTNPVGGTIGERAFNLLEHGVEPVAGGGIVAAAGLS